MVDEDPWNRPDIEDIRKVLQNIGKSEVVHDRSVERLDLSVPAEVTTIRGNTISAMTREISRYGIGLIHRGMISPGEVTIRMASDTRNFEYVVKLEWCRPGADGMYLSGGRFIRQNSMSDE